MKNQCYLGVLYALVLYGKYGASVVKNAGRKRISDICG